MTRREAAEKVFNYIKECKFKPKNIEYGDGYFIFEMGDDSVVHFDIKGLHGWKFAMWIETDEEKLKNENGVDYPAIQFFCQHKENIDKFKPSRSFFLKELSLDDIENEYFYGIEEMLRTIKRHPFVSFAMDLHEGSFYFRSYIFCYIRAKLYNIKSSTKEWCKDAWTKFWHGSKVWFIKRYKVVDSVQLVDKNGDGWKVSPRYDMDIHFKKIFEDEEQQNEAECKVLNRFFKKDDYNNMHLFLTRDGIDGCYGYTRD